MGVAGCTLVVSCEDEWSIRLILSKVHDGTTYICTCTRDVFNRQNCSYYLSSSIIIQLSILSIIRDCIGFLLRKAGISFHSN